MAALKLAEEAGARTRVFVGEAVGLPMYHTGTEARTAEATAVVEAMRECKGLILATPAYHGSFSGTLKNLLDYAEDMNKDASPYLQDRSVGLITAGDGWRAPGMALSALRSVVHALRGWPVPMGVALNENDPCFMDPDDSLSPSVATQMGIMVEQVVSFARKELLWQSK